MAVLRTHHGFLVTLEKTGDEPGFGYAGTLAADEREYPVRFAVDAAGAVTVAEAGACPAELAERARLVVRAALKQNAGLELPPPRRITRWRPGK